MPGKEEHLRFRRYRNRFQEFDRWDTFRYPFELATYLYSHTNVDLIRKKEIVICFHRQKTCVNNFKRNEFSTHQDMTLAQYSYLFQMIVA